MDAIEWVVPWTGAQIVNASFLGVATLVVVVVPLIYGLRANLRDPLARGVLAGTSATALAFVVTLAATIAHHAGWTPTLTTLNWMTRAVYGAVAVGQTLLVLELLRLLRQQRRSTSGPEGA